MHQPIFASDTGFLLPLPGGRRFVPGSTEPDLGSGAKVVMLDTPMNLVRVTTDIGVSVDVTPETIFSFTVKDGSVLLYVPSDLTLLKATPVSWGGIWGGDMDPRRWWIIGAIHSGGAFSSERNRPARLIISGEIADRVEDFIRRISINPAFRFEGVQRGIHAVNRVDIEGDLAIVTSRIIDKLIGNFLLAGSKQLLFSIDDLSVECRHAFLSGVLAGMSAKEGNLVFSSRYADIVRQMHRIFMETAGLFSTLSINPMEPEVQKSTRVTYPHNCYLDDDALRAAEHLGLLTPQVRKPGVSGFRTVRIVDAQPIGKHPACTVEASADTTFVANWFVSKSSFTLPEAVNVAAHPMVVDPAKFEEVHK